MALPEEETKQSLESEEKPSENACFLQKIIKRIFVLEKIKPYLKQNAIICFDELYNYEGWKVHMTGMKQMVDLKGGVAGFSPGLQLKMHR